MTAWGHVLLAEDNPVNQRVTRAMLEHLGFHVDVVADGAEAVNAAATTPYRAILMDCQLPVLDGYLATTEIRRWQGASRRTPIIAVTASARATDEQRCLTAGMDDFITKPIGMRTLADVLARWAPDSPDVPGPPDASRPPDPPAPEDFEEVADAPPVLDPEIVERLERLGDSAGEDLMGQLTILYLADADDYVVALRAAVSANDGAAMVRSAHTFSGSSGNIGALRLAGLCSSLMTDGMVAGPDARLVRVEEIDAELALVRCALEARRVTS
ncbi:MAG: response regulator [Acidimicrobiia bacterium]